MSRSVRREVLYIERASLEEVTHEKLTLKYSRDNTCISVLQNFRFFFRPPLTFMEFCQILNPGRHNRLKSPLTVSVEKRATNGCSKGLWSLPNCYE